MLNRSWKPFNLEEFISNVTDYCESNDARMVYTNRYLGGDCFPPEFGIVSVDYYIIPRCYPNVCTDDDLNAEIAANLPPCTYSIEMSDMTFPKKPKGCSFIWEEQSDKSAKSSKTPKASKSPKVKKMASKMMKAGV